VFAAALEGRKARWIGPLDVPHAVSYLPDIARGLATLGERPAADGQAWHLPVAEPLIGREFLELVFAELGQPPKIGSLSRLGQRIIGLVNPTVRELGETWYQRDRPWLVDTARFQQAFGPQPATPQPEAIAHTLDWYRRRAR
jgi:nucleoside-diphosphate-sugar epimerase